MRPSLVRAIQRRTATVAVSPSAARRQGAAGVVDRLRFALDHLRLRQFDVASEEQFRRALDRATRSVMVQLPRAARSWGLARKVLNIYLRDCYYNAYLRRAFGRRVRETWFEVPLDRVVADGLRAHCDMSQPRWPGVKRLTAEESEQYQAAAAWLCARWGVTRVHLDTYLWVDGR